MSNNKDPVENAFNDYFNNFFSTDKSSNSEQDPIQDIFTSVIDDYKSAFTQCANGYKKETDEKLPKPYRLGLIDLIIKTVKNTFDIKSYGESNVARCRLSISLVYSIYTGYKLYTLTRQLSYLFYSIPASMIISGLIKTQYTRDKINQLNYTMFMNNLRDEIRFIDLKMVSKGQGTAIAKVTIPLSSVDKNVLEVAFNATITNIKNIGSSKRLIQVTFDKGKTYIYQDIPKEDTVNRLEAVLIFYKAYPKFVNASENEVGTVYKFFTNIPKKKLTRLIPDIEHKLGIKKGSLELDFEGGYTLFNIKKEFIKQIYIDDIIKNVKRSEGMPVVIGLNRSNNVSVVLDLHRLQHMLIGGKTGQGKSSLLHSMIYSAMWWNDDVVFSMFDLKGTELRLYKDFSNCEVCTIEDTEELIKTVKTRILPQLERCYEEYKNRIKLFMSAGVKDLKGYIEKTGKVLPTYIVLIDEANNIRRILQKEMSGDKELKLLYARLETIINTLAN
jgi:hypothetical protein